MPDVPIFSAKLNAPRGTGSVPIFGDNSTGREAFNLQLIVPCEEIFILIIKEKKETLKEKVTQKYNE